MQVTCDKMHFGLLRSMYPFRPAFYTLHHVTAPERRGDGPFAGRGLRWVTLLLAFWYLLSLSAAVSHHHAMPGAGSAMHHTQADGTTDSAISAPHCSFCDFEATTVHLPSISEPFITPVLTTVPTAKASALRSRLASLPAPRRSPRAPPAFIAA